MTDPKIKIRLRLVIIKNQHLLLSYTSEEDFYFYIGGKLEYGETVLEGCQREIKEECGEGVNFEFKKILYVRDFILPEEEEHSLELFILGNVDKYQEIEGVKDPEFDNKKWQTWVDLKKLPEINIKPQTLTKKLLADYQDGFPKTGEYVGQID
jgi:ADP-ribose pyrophosphatase YjhB (NUDIX family)